MIQVKINPARSIGTINKNIYGHFSEHLGRCIYQGLFVGKDSPIPNRNGMRTDVVEALKAIHIPVLRWPGGCFADEYHWQDGIGPQEGRKRMVNTHWGYVVEDNSFGTHEFMELCQQLGCEPYVNGNLGSGTVREMSEWVEYMNSDGDSTVVRQRWANGRKEPWGVKYFAVGNENWGCGGNMRPEYYADEYRRYQTYCRNYGQNKLFKIACGPNSGDFEWTETLMKRCAGMMNGLSLHYYTVTGSNWEDKGKALTFSKEEYYELLQKGEHMEDLVIGHGQIMDRYDPEKKVGLVVDEWGAWYQVEEGTNPGFLYQQNTMRDAVLAAIHLNLFNRHCDRVVMANLAQTVNVLQSVILTEGDRMALTPTYHVFEMFKEHQGAKELDCWTDAERVGLGQWSVKQISASASEKDGVATVTLANCHADDAADICLSGIGGEVLSARLLTGALDAHNDFDSSPVAPKALEDVRAESNGLRLTLPPCSVAAVRVKL